MGILIASSSPKRAQPPDRRRIDEILDIVSAPSPYGSSKFKRIRLCPREAGLHDIGLRSTGISEALDLGLLFHFALETVFKTLQKYQQYIDAAGGARNDLYFWGGLPAAESAGMRYIQPFAREEGYEETFKLLERMLSSYFEMYRRRDRWRIVAVEETLIYEDDGLQYSARLDLIVECFDRGGMYVVEHKTAKAITADLLQSYQLDLQILGQAWLMQNVVDLTQLPPMRGLIVDIITKHERATRFERLLVSPSVHHLENFETQVRSWTQVHALWEELGWPQALGNCAGAARFFKQCRFYNICHGRPGVSVADLEKEYRGAAGPPDGYLLVDDSTQTDAVDAGRYVR